MDGNPMRESEDIRPEYATDGSSLFWLALRTALFTIVTLGLYRFWMVTRLRRHYWSAIRIDGDPLEYNGTGLEKFLGFLIAIVILAVYLAVVNVGLAFAGLTNFDDPVQLQIVINLSVLATLPLIYFAVYRAQRYILARTRWRGIRFGMDQAAWRYTGSAMLLTLVTICTLGLAYPYQHFRLTKFKIDRTWFGDLRFKQEGNWRPLLGYWLWIYAIVLAGVVSGVFLAMDPENPMAAAIAGIVISFGYLAVILLALRYNVAAFRYFWEHRKLSSVRFVNDIDTGEVIGITIVGSMAAGFCAFLVALVAIVIAGLVYLGVFGLDGLAALQTQADDPAALAQAAPLLLAIAGAYLIAIASGFAFSQIFLIRPILRRKVEGMLIIGAEELTTSRQREHDHATEAGGFADALGVDVGAGF